MTSCHVAPWKVGCPHSALSSCLMHAQRSHEEPIVAEVYACTHTHYCTSNTRFRSSCRLQNSRAMSFGGRHTALTRRTLGLAAVGLVGGGILYNSARSSRTSVQPLHVMSARPGAGPRASTGLGPATDMLTGPLPRKDAPTKAVNLRDVGEVSAVLRKGVLYRCSQIYTQEVLKDLKIRTVVDLRGRAEKGKKKQTLQRTASGHMAPVPSEAAGSAAAQGTPAPLLPAEARDALAAADANAKLTPEQHQAAKAAGVGLATVSGEDFVAVRGVRGMDSLSSADEAGSYTSASSASNIPPVTSSQKEASSAGAMAAAAMEEAMAEVENFNLIPTKEFGLTMLRMPRRVWAAALGNLVTGQDPRRPFVDAFANEQLLGFTKYYKIILEHSKKSLAAVLRVFAKERNLPALVHCAHGKDRTGVVIMLLLMVCGVPHEAIVGDYVQSEVELRRYRESLGLPDPSGAKGAIIPLNEVIIASTAETLRAVLAYMDEQYISVDNYMASCGLSPQEIASIRANLMTPAAVAALKEEQRQQPAGVSSGRAAAAAAAPAGSAEL